MNKCQLVRQTCKKVLNQAQNVKIDNQKLKLLATQFNYRPFTSDSYHKTNQNPQIALFQLFVLDHMNFCFWPLPQFQYQHLATHIQNFINKGMRLDNIKDISQQQMIKQIFGGTKVPMANQRARILRQLALVVTQYFDGSFVKIIQKCQKSVVKLLNILTMYFPNFQDHSIYKGEQIHFYKRPQILIGDIFGCFNGKDLGQFTDINQLTMFPDYRVPQILQAQGVFQYSQFLTQTIKNKQVITDKQIECEIRACSVWAVQMIKQELKKSGKQVLSIEVDWFLWQRGQQKLGSLPQHHRCLTIFY